LIEQRTEALPSEPRGTLHPASDDSTRSTEVTAIVVSHNSAHHLPRLGHALAAGTLVPDRMLVIDNGSADETVRRGHLAGFEVYETGTNDGFGAACNIALRMATTEFVLFCNPDVSPSPNALELLVAALRRTPMAAVAGVAFDRPFLARRFSRITGDVWIFLPSWLQRPLRRFATEMPVDPGQEQVVVDYVVGAFMLCRVAALRLVNGFDQRFFLYCEEEDLSRRLGERSWVTLLVPPATVAHNHSTSSKGTDGTVMAQFLFHSLYRYYRKYHSRLYADFSRCVHSLCVILDQGYRAVTHKPQAYGPWTARAPFRSIDSLRRAHERRTAKTPCVAPCDDA
jgi:GT2 family glycosyltransferase